MKDLIPLFILLFVVVSLPDEDLVYPVPGMQNQTIYSGYLNTRLEDRKLHYVFVAARSKKQQAPLTIWLNGGPGCSSLLGMFQQIGPYMTPNIFKFGQNLIRNPFSWNQVSNLLFLQSPAIVGFSSDTNVNVTYNDTQTADDAFQAIRYFVKYTAIQFSQRSLFITGQSYAGKYIPDITVRILRYNQQPRSDPINLKGIFVGNGVINFAGNSLERSQIQYMIQHDFVDDRLFSIYQLSCRRDFHSPRCQYFRYQLRMDQDQVNRYNVYEVCYKLKSTEAVRMLQSIRKLSNQTSSNDKLLQYSSKPLNLDSIIECPMDNGTIDYLNSYQQQYHVEKYKKIWQPCSQIRYHISLDGSIAQYHQILQNPQVKVWLYSGDWDDVVPFTDTQKNLQLLGMQKVNTYKPWFVNKIHAGFYQEYQKKLFLITFKGGSHMVPQTRGQAALQMFNNFITDQPVNTPYNSSSE